MGVLTYFKPTGLIEEHLSLMVRLVLNRRYFHLRAIAILVVYNICRQQLGSGHVLQQYSLARLHRQILEVLSVPSGFRVDAPHCVVSFTCE